MSVLTSWELKYSHQSILPGTVQIFLNQSWVKRPSMHEDFFFPCQIRFKFNRIVNNIKLDGFPVHLCFKGSLCQWLYITWLLTDVFTLCSDDVCQTVRVKCPDQPLQHFAHACKTLTSSCRFPVPPAGGSLHNTNVHCETLGGYFFYTVPKTSIKGRNIIKLHI